MVANARKAVLYSSESLTASNQASASVDCRGATEVTIYIKSEAVTGTSPTLDFDVQCSYQQDGGYHKDSDITQIGNVSDNTLETIHKVSNPPGWLRLNPTLGGTDPNYTISAWAIIRG